MIVWRQRVLDALFVATEAVAWYLMLHVVATGLEQSFLKVIGERLSLSMSSLLPAEISRARDMLVEMERAATQEHGPPFLAVMAIAFGGFALMRVLMRYRFDGALGAVALIAGSVLGLNVLLHLALSGDLRIWDPAGLVTFTSDPEQAFAGQVDLARFLARPELGRTHGMALGMMFFGLVAMWTRFVLAARAPVSFDRALRSFSIGFVVVLGCVLAARFEGQVTLTIFAVPHFVLGVLTLAIANNARSVVPIEGERRTGPWIAAVAGTVAILAGVAVILGVLAFVNAGAALTVLGTIAGNILIVVIVILTTPLFWVIEGIARWLLPADLAERLERLRQLQLEALAPLPQQPNTEPGAMPLWLQNGLRFLAVVIIAWVVWRIARAIMGRRRSGPPPVDELRGRASSGTGLGGLLRDLFPRRARAQSDDWLGGRPIYRLYGRAVNEGQRRGFRYLPGETPLEFSERATRLMDAPYEPIGDAFDAARYGRHFPSTEDVRVLEADLARWEAATPPTEELRERLAGAQPLTPEVETALVMRRMRQATEEVRRRSRGGPVAPDPRDTPQL